MTTIINVTLCDKKKQYRYQNLTNTHETILITQIGAMTIIDSSTNSTYLRLRSGEAQRTETLGTDGAKRIAIATWLRHSRDKASRWLSDGVFFGGAELRSNEARLSLTGLRVQMENEHSN